MKNDLVCWIDSRTIKRGRVLMLDGSLVPFCSICLDACMRANGIFKSLKRIKSLRADCLRADSPPLGCGRSAIHFENDQRHVLSLVGKLNDGRTVRSRRADGPPL